MLPDDTTLWSSIVHVQPTTIVCEYCRCGAQNVICLPCFRLFWCGENKRYALRLLSHLDSWMRAIYISQLSTEDWLCMYLRREIHYTLSLFLFWPVLLPTTGLCVSILIQDRSGVEKSLSSVVPTMPNSPQTPQDEDAKDKMFRFPRSRKAKVSIAVDLLIVICSKFPLFYAFFLLFYKN